jgi:hypothetical protein
MTINLEDMELHIEFVVLQAAYPVKACVLIEISGFNIVYGIDYDKFLR